MAYSRLTIHPEAKCLREELEGMRQSVVIAKHSEAMAVRGRQMAQRELADAVKALETAREDLGLFRDFVINNATVWVSGSNHHHPMWERIARHLEAYQSPTTGDLWKLVCSADLAARSAPIQGGE